MIKLMLFILLIFAEGLIAKAKLHPLFEIENIHPNHGPDLKVTAMAFEGKDLYLTVCTPNRQSLAPYKKGELVKITGLTDSPITDVKSEVLFSGLYQPTAVAVLNGTIYIGEKDNIIRLEDKNKDGKYQQNEKVTLIEGLSDDNFHQFTFGFDKISRSGKTYLVGNFSTAVLLGGKRDLNVTPNPEVKRGTTFLLGPVTGKETASDVKLEYIAGGLRTPNGLGLDIDQNIFVTDNQGIFNPTNKFIRVKPGSFYGHYSIKKENTSYSAYQPQSVDSVNGDSAYQEPPTVHLANLSRSPGNPLFIKGLKGEASAYNGQFLIPEIKGKMLRVFTEEVEGVWQGALFLHSEGIDTEGKKGFTGPPNRIIEGPDQHYYIGHIGAGGGWGVKGKPELQTGLQRMKFKQDFPADFNEMLAVRNTVEGLEIEFLRPMSHEALNKDFFKVKQWTYIPTQFYGGRPIGVENIEVSEIKILEGGKKLQLVLKGLRDNRPPYIYGTHPYSNKNYGWVVEVTYASNRANLWNDTFWYTMNRHQGNTSQKPIVGVTNVDSSKILKSVYKPLCANCHTLDGNRLVGPSFKGIFNRKQTVIREGKEIDISIDEDYLLRAIKKPLHEYPKGYPPAMPEINISSGEIAAMIEWMKTL